MNEREPAGLFEQLIPRGILLTVGTLILVVLGLLAASRIPVQMIPDLDVRTVSVRTSWPGATPQDVEREILIEQEEYLRNVQNLQRITATAASGSAEIELEFPFGVNITEVLIDVNNALSQVPSYPVTVDEPQIFASSFSSNSFMYFRVAPLPGNPRSLDMDMMRDFVIDNVRTRMSSVPGVSEVQVWGGAERQVRVLLDAAALAERNLSVIDVRTAVRARNRDVSGGEIDSGKRRYLLRTVGRFDSLEDLRQLIISRRADAVVRLGEVATIDLDHFEVQGTTYTDGAPVLFLAVRRESGSNVIDIKYAMLEAVKTVNEEVLQPAGMDVALIAEDVAYVEASIANVWKNLMLGAIFATLVMYGFLRSVRATAVGVIGIPVCTIAAFIGLLVAERTINVISLAGVAFAIGMTLDNSIVVLESIELERRKGLDRLRAAIEGVRQVWPAVLASTLTTILVFVPIIFIEQEAGQLYSDIAIAISASILVSMLVAILVIPAAAAHLDFESRLAASAENTGIRGAVLRGVEWLTCRPGRRISVIVLAAAASLAAIVWLTPPAEYLPEGEEPKTFASLNAPPGYNLQEMSLIGEEIQAYFLQFLDDAPESFARGETPVPAMKYLNIRVAPDRIRIISEPKDPQYIDELMDAIEKKYREYPGMRPFVTRGSIITSNDAGSRSVDVDISGRDLRSIYAVAQQIYTRTEEVLGEPRIQSRPSSLSLAQPLVEVRPDWDRAADLGLNADDFGYLVAALTDGAYVDEFFLADDKIDIYLYSLRGTNARLDELGNLPVHTPAGVILPLSSLAEIRETVDTSSVRRVDGQRTVTLNIIPPREMALETGVLRVRGEVIQHLRSLGEIPADVNIRISGAADQLQATREALGSNYLVALVIIYLLLVAIFSHWGYPLLIMTTIPLGVASGIVGLWLMNAAGAFLPALGLEALHQPFDMISMLGFLILMGTVVNNPILIVHRAVSNVREQAMEAATAVREAIEVRLRPIAMSTLTTVCGLSPLVFLPGEGTELYRGVGAIVLFGILGTAVVTLTMLPALTILVLQRIYKFKGSE